MRAVVEPAVEGERREVIERVRMAWLLIWGAGYHPATASSGISQLLDFGGDRVVHDDMTVVLMPASDGNCQYTQYTITYTRPNCCQRDDGEIVMVAGRRQWQLFCRPEV